MVGVLDHKKRARRTIHESGAVLAFYSAPGSTEERSVRVRWHNRIQPTTSIVDGGVGMIDNIEKLVFADYDLNAPVDGGDSIELETGGLVRIPEYDGGADKTVQLENKLIPDGPVNEYWGVATQW